MATKPEVNANGNEANGNAEVLSYPHLQFTDRMWQLPVIQSAWACSQQTYTKVKESNSMFNWALNTAEQTVQKALEQAAPIAIPVLNKLPIQLADNTLCMGLDSLQNHVPQVNDPPSKIFDDAKNKVHQVLQPTIDKLSAAKTSGTQTAHSLTDLSWAKANEVLATHYGTMAMNGVTSTTALADRLLDHYFPAEEDENASTSSDAPITPEDDRVLYTVQNVGRLSNKLARRVYRTVSKQIKTLKKEDVKEYVASLIAILQLTQYLNYVSGKIQNVAATTTQETAKQTEKPADGSQQ